MVLHQVAIEPAEQAALEPWLAGSGPVSTPRTAATVLLIRPTAAAAPDASTGGRDSLEVFLLRRRASMAFAARMHAFPGGGVDPRDSDIAVPWTGPSPVEWGQALGCPVELATALVCAAVRELFEECGVLLAGATPDSVVDDVSDASWEADRVALLDRSLALSELLERRGLSLRSDLLRPWAHWLTPVFEPRRFDTWFFVAALPAGQRARDVGDEADRADWIELADLLRRHRAGRLAMMLPTSATLEDVVSTLASRVDGASPIDAVLGATRRLRRVSPWLARDANGAPIMVVDLDGRGGGTPP